MGFVLPISLWVVVVSVLLVFSQEKHFLSVLLGIESLFLGIYIGCLTLVSSDVAAPGVEFGLVVLVFGVCDAALGLGLLVSSCRSSGVDNLGSFFSLV